MSNTTIGRLLLVAIAIAGLVLATPVVGAHGTATTPTDAPPADGSADDWATWMESHMTDHMGPGATEWMESHMGATVEEMAAYMAGGDHPRGYGQGHC